MNIFLFYAKKCHQSDKNVEMVEYIDRTIAISHKRFRILKKAHTHFTRFQMASEYLKINNWISLLSSRIADWNGQLLNCSYYVVDFFVSSNVFFHSYIKLTHSMFEIPKCSTELHDQVFARPCACMSVLYWLCPATHRTLFSCFVVFTVQLFVSTNATMLYWSKKHPATCQLSHAKQRRVWQQKHTISVQSVFFRWFFKHSTISVRTSSDLDIYAANILYNETDITRTIAHSIRCVPGIRCNSINYFAANLTEVRIPLKWQHFLRRGSGIALAVFVIKRRHDLITWS